MPWRPKRRFDFSAGLVAGTVLGAGASTMFGSELHEGAQRLQQEERRWQAEAAEIAVQARNQAAAFFARADADVQSQLTNLTDAISGGDRSAEE